MSADERAQIRRISGELDHVLERAVVKVAMDVSNEVTPDTPIDTGWARNSWISYVGYAPDAPVGDRSPGGVAAAAAARATGILQLLAYKLRDGLVFVVNNVPYIEVLNDGHSAQAPAGFVQAAITRAVRRFRSFRG